MTDNKGARPISVRNRRLLRAIFPAGIVLLVFWAVFVVVGLIVPAQAMSVGTGILGLVTSIGLIVSGRSFRRSLDDS